MGKVFGDAGGGRDGEQSERKGEDGDGVASEQVAEAIERRCRTDELERLEHGELGVSGAEGLVSMRLTESKGRCRWRSVATMRCIPAMEISLASWRRRRR